MTDRLFITGVSGFIGRHVAAEALRRGYEVGGMDRSPGAPSDVRFTRGDIRDEDTVRRAVAGYDHVVHLAAVTSNVEFVRCPAQAYDVNVTGFLVVADAVARAGGESLLYASSAAVYHDSFSEDSVLDGRAQRNHYAKSKLMNEMMAASYADVSGLRTCGLRFFNTYGDGENDKGDYASIVTIFLRARRAGAPLVVYGDGSQARDLIHVHDAARITLDLLERGSCSVYNVGTGIATDYRTIASLIDRDHVRYVPNPLPSYQHYTRADTRRLARALGEYAFTSLADGMQTLCVDTGSTTSSRVP